MNAPLPARQAPPAPLDALLEQHCDNATVRALVGAYADVVRAYDVLALTLAALGPGEGERDKRVRQRWLEAIASARAQAERAGVRCTREVASAAGVSGERSEGSV